MSTYTTNYNLEKPDSTDNFKDFRSNYNSNMDIIDANLGGGGGNVNDVLVNGVSVVDGNHDAQITSYKEVTQAEYNALPATKLTDGIAYYIKDANSSIGIINGVFINTDRVITSGTITAGSTVSYTATEDCAFDFLAYSYNGSNAFLQIDGKNIFTSSAGTNRNTFLLKKGQVATVGSYNTNGSYTVYGLKGGDSSSSHNYSTTEQVIGTWIDGKPIYECTFYVASASLSSGEYAISTGLSNIKKIINYSGFLSDGSRTYTLPYERLIEKESIRLMTRVNADGTVTMNIITGVGGSSVYSTVTDIYVTITYTKTTD